MKIAILVHPPWVASRSMPRFAGMIQRGMTARGHEVTQLTATARLSKFKSKSAFVQKWLGYADQFLLFPRELRRQVDTLPGDTLFVVADQALGMWVPHIRHRPHVIHCHDFLALRSARGEFPENRTRASGKKYQTLIKDGFSQGEHFISVSKKTQDDLHSILGAEPKGSHVVYNGLNGEFGVLANEASESILKKHLQPDDHQGFLLHVGGNQWYKNRAGVIRLYQQWCRVSTTVMPLWMVGSEPTDSLKRLAIEIPNGGKVRFLSGMSDAEVQAAYNLAKLFVFPSLEEGFGWPIAEAMACGTAVLTTDGAPMKEVGGDAAIYHRRLSIGEEESWAREGAAKIDAFLRSPESERNEIIRKGWARAEAFDSDATIRQYEEIYQGIVENRPQVLHASMAS